jgi:surfactin synthase thioesterase subunit
VARRLEADGCPPAGLFASGRRAPSRFRQESVHRSSDAGILAEVRRLNGTASSVLGDEEMMQAALPALRGDYQAIETYTCPEDVTVTCPVTVLAGDSDPRTSLEEARAWERHTSGSFDLRVFPGGHFFLVHQSDEIMKLLRDHFAVTR